MGEQAALAKKYAGCMDEHGSCGRWARDGECDANPSFMHKVCRSSCAECESVKCHDNQDGCAAWAGNGQCESNSNFMLKECPFSCRVCGIDFKPECRRDKAMWPGGV